jgi:hypothetical protein
MSNNLKRPPIKTEEPKELPTFPPSETICQLELRNQFLRHKVTYYDQMEPARKEFESDVTEICHSFQRKLTCCTLLSFKRALLKLRKVQQVLDPEWLQTAYGMQSSV